MSAGAGDSLRLLRVIARLNVGGPAIQAITLTKLLEPHGFATTLVRGQEAPEEGNMDHLAAALGVAPRRLTTLRRDPGPNDLAALAALTRIIRQSRPALVHTHAAKAGTLGRLAAIAASVGRRRPAVIHTYHGHSLSGYFSDRTAAVYRGIERALAHHSDRLVAVSAEVRDELVDLGVAPATKFTVVPLGFDLAPFAADPATAEAHRRAIRAELDLSADSTVVTLVARLVPIKRVDRFLAAARTLAEQRTVGPPTRFLIVGDGELRDQLQASDAARGLGDALRWTGFRRDMPAILHASDLVVQTSDNEGTPVSLIEAQAAGRPVVSTTVGGTASVVADGHTGLLVAREDVPGLAAAMGRLIASPELARAMGAAGRERALARFGLGRLIDDLLGLYAEVGVRP